MGSHLKEEQEHQGYVPQSVDATNAPTADALLKNMPDMKGKNGHELFSLAFHHFDDDLAGKVLENTIETLMILVRAVHLRRL